ncbi:MAG: GNAT family N-acetyltransferase [Candidatus Izimaplasma sp.]|nr:GNAT family N-acetyltransferase [Candidatus Izimaplasma bacterium]
MIELKSIDWDNFWDVIEISPKSSQKDFLKTVSVFMAQSYVNLKENYPDVSLAIYNGENLIGFTKIVYVPIDVKPYCLDSNSYMIDALIIDKIYQENGYGKEALSQIIDYVKTKPFGKAETISLVSYEKNNIAINLFENFGFKKVKPKDQEKRMYIYTKEL